MAPCFVILQTEQLLFLSVKFLLGNDAHIKEFFVFFNFLDIVYRNFFDNRDGNRSRHGFALTFDQ